MSLVNTLKEIAGSFSSYKSHYQEQLDINARLINEISSLRKSIGSLEEANLRYRSTIEQAEELADEILDAIKQASGDQE